MLGNRILILAVACILGASAAWADDVGFVDCSSHSEGTQVFGKPRKTPDVVTALPCGQPFTILVYGFYFSRIQTKDGQVGYIYSNLITVGPVGKTVQQQQAAPQIEQRPAPREVQQVPSLEMAAEKTKIPHEPAQDAAPKPAPVAHSDSSAAQADSAVAPQPQPEAVQPPSAQPPVPASSSSNADSSAPQPAPDAAVQPEPASSQPEPVAVQPVPPAPPEVAPQPAAQPAPGSAAPAPNVPDVPQATVATAETAPPAAFPQPEPAPEPPAATPAQPQPASAQPEPDPAQPAPPPIKPADKIETWEKPRPGVRTAPLIELYGGFSFARLGGTSSGNNLAGAIGSFGWNPKPWLQVVADTSYSLESSGTTKNVLYGNHYGPRFFHRVRSRWGLTPFVEGLVGGSDEKTTVSGSGGYTASTGATLSYKVGGGLDMHPSRHWDIRLFDVDYYRTSFGAGTPQNNYWISTGIVLRLFGGGAQ
ncbi:MAG: hypothetical protein WBE13_10540 [Candidatus Acidiferrum sp.]